MLKDALKLIQETAVEAKSVKQFRTGHRETTLVFPDQTEKKIIEEQPESRNKLLTIEDAIRVFRAENDPTIWVSDQEIVVLHDSKERFGVSVVRVEKPRAVELILKADDEENWMSPEEFERIAILRFGADEKFIDRLRTLQWSTEQKESEQRSNISKSASVTMIAKILDKNGVEYQDVFLNVLTPIFDVPVKTKEISIELQIVANAQRKAISFAPKPGIMAENVREATRELYHLVCQQLDTEAEIKRVFMGMPILKR